MHPGAGDLIVLAVVLVVIFSASRMGALGNALGQFVNSFRKASRGEGYVDGKVTKRIGDKAGIEDAQVVDSHPPRKS
jgi:sec-independent protein translocase protein TatA